MGRGWAWLLGAGAVAALVAVATSGVDVTEAGIRALSIRVRNRARLLGVVDPRFLAMLDWWDKNGRFRVTVGTWGGVRDGALAAQAQLGFYEKQTSNARTLSETPHGLRGTPPRGSAVDLWPYQDGTVNPAFDADTNPVTRARYAEIARVGRRFGLVSGASWGDLPHLEVPDWRALQYSGDEGGQA